MFPAAALAAELTRRGVAVVIVTDARGFKYRAAFAGLPVHVVTTGVPAGGPAARARGAWHLLKGLWQGARLVRTLRPAAVVGFGGFPSLPGVAGACLNRVPLVLHEQNAVMGKVNALLAGRAALVATSYPETGRVPGGARQRLVLTGPLVRAEITALHDRPYPDLGPDSRLRVLIMGGSQGARILSTIVPAAFALLPEDMRRRLSIVQQSRAEDRTDAAALYGAAGIDAALSPFLDDVPAQLAAAHLFIGRAGGTVAEIAAAGRPAIFIPYPHHADQQQKINAEAVAREGGAWVMTEDTLTPAALAAQLEKLFGDPELLIHAASAARGCGRPDAAEKLADAILSLT